MHVNNLSIHKQLVLLRAEGLGLRLGATTVVSPEGITENESNSSGLGKGLQDVTI